MSLDLKSFFIEPVLGRCTVTLNRYIKNYLEDDVMISFLIALSLYLDIYNTNVSSSIL